MINSVTIVGRLVAKPEIRTTQTGNQVASFRIANDDGRRGPNNEKQSVFLNCTLFGRQVETLSKHFDKGDAIGIIGRLTQRTYTNRQNVQVTVTEILADRIEFVESKKQLGEGAGNSGYVQDPAPAPYAPQTPSQESDYDAMDVTEPDLPF